MINLNQILSTSFSFLKKQAPTILAVLGSAGVVGTGILAAKGREKYQQSFTDEKHRVKIRFQSYAPAILVGTASIACILGSNAISGRRQASLMSAYCMLGNAFLSYQEKNREIFGEDSDQIIRKQIAQDRYEIDIFKDKGRETQLFYLDSYGYFESTVEEVLQAEYRLNKKFKDEGQCNINDLHEFLNLEPVNGGEYQSWYSKTCQTNDEEPAFEGILDFLHDIVYLPDGLEATMITLATPASYGGYEWPF